MVLRRTCGFLTLHLVITCTGLIVLFVKKNKREQNNVHRTMTYKTTVIINARSFRMPIWRKYVRLSTYFCVCTFVFLMAKTSRNIPLRSTFRFMPFLIHCIELERFPGVKRTYRFAHVSTHTHKGKPVTVTTGCWTCPAVELFAAVFN